MAQHQKNAVSKQTSTHAARDVFLSYALTDGQIARMLCDKLESVGVSVWYATRDLMPGGDFGMNIPPMIRQSKVFLIILSEISMKLPRCLTELNLAFNYRKQGLSILPVLISDEPLTDELDYYLGVLRCIKAPDPLADNSFLDEVAERVQELLKAP